MLVLKLLTSLALRRLTKYLDHSQIGGATPPTWYCRPLRMANFDTMSIKRLVITAVILGLYAGAAQMFVARLDVATATQCRTHDWPENKHANMMDFCISYGYPTK